MNIAFLHRLWPSYGGGETVTKCLANELIRRGYTVHVLYFKQTLNAGDSMETHHAIRTYRIDGISLNEFSKEFFVNKNEARRASQELVKYVNANNINFIINQWWPVEFHHGIHQHTNAKVIKCLHMDPNTKKIYEFVGIKKVTFKMVEPLYRKIETAKHLYSSNKYLRNSDKYIFLAPSFLNYYRKKSKNEDRFAKTDYIYNPLVFETFLSPEEWDQKEKRVLFVGRLVEGHKKVSRILSVWERYERELNDGWELDIVGDGPDRERYENFVNNHNLHHVKFYGFQDPKHYYRRASIFLMTSAYEGWPMTIIESMQSGVVSIGMNSYLALSDLIMDKKNGVIVPDADCNSMYQEMVSLMKNSEQRKQIAFQGIESCKQYKVSNIVDKWELIFKELNDKK